MKTKLTLTIEEDIIRKAKVYAKGTDRSLSTLIENHLRAIVDEDIDKTKLSSQLKKLVGSVKLPNDFDEKTALR